jgi:ectoine hydroxylase-related dioxygenase (phytanoyl-CoA dioxygenase family)
MIITSEFVERVTRDGFAVTPDCIQTSEVSNLTVTLDHLDTSNSIRRGNQVYAIRNLLDVLPAVRELANSRNVRDLVEPLLGTRCFVVKATLFDKRPEANWTVPFHQDLSIAVQEKSDAKGFGPWSEKKGVLHVQPPVEILEGMLALRLHLDDCDESNAPLRVIPGSHLHGRMNDAEIDEWTSTHPSVCCTVARGGVLVMRPLLLHASSPARSPARRRVIHLEFAAEKLPEGLQWHHSPMNTCN